MSVNQPPVTEQEPQDKWGDPISEERQRELLGMLEAWDAPGADHGGRKGPFDSTRLTYYEREREHLLLNGADVFWLAERVRQPGFSPAYPGPVPDLHLETLYVNSCAGTMSVSPEMGVPLRREAIGMSIPRPTSVHTHPATTPRP